MVVPDQAVRCTLDSVEAHALLSEQLAISHNWNGRCICFGAYDWLSCYFSRRSIAEELVDHLAMFWTFAWLHRYLILAGIVRGAILPLFQYRIEIQNAARLLVLVSLDDGVPWRSIRLHSPHVELFAFCECFTPDHSDRLLVNWIHARDLTLFDWCLWFLSETAELFQAIVTLKNACSIELCRARILLQPALWPFPFQEILHLFKWLSRVVVAFVARG